MSKQNQSRRRPGCSASPCRLISISLLASSIIGNQVSAFTVTSPSIGRRPTFLSIIAPPGSGYARPEDETSPFPDTYEPMMEYPGTMRPGRTPENMPFQDLPIGDNDPDPVPWPHFQQIEWHHRWDPPHEHPIPMEDFIEMHGRWATPEMEAAMRAGVRRGVRERRQEEESGKASVIITDDDDDELGGIPDDPISLGDGVFGQLGSDADRAATAKAVDPANQGKEEEEEEEGDDGLDDFLLDLGLDADFDDDEDDDSQKSKGGKKKGKSKTDSSFDLDFGDDDEDDDFDDSDDTPSKGVSLTASSGSDTTTIDVDDDDDIVLDDDDELEGDIPLDDFNDDDDTLDTEDIFDEGGFDFDDDFGDIDGGDMW